MAIASDIVQSIGQTPLVRLRLTPAAKAPVFAKMELSNPYGMKDRAARHIIRSARRSGALAPGGLVVESSSGTMALGVALVATHLGHPVHIVTDPRIDELTLAKLTALGCTIDVVRRMTANGWQSARVERLHEVLAASPGSFWPRQYENPGNPAGYEALAEELLTDLGHVDVLVGSVGSGGSLCGTARVLRLHNPTLRVVAVDATGSAIFGQPDRPQRLQSGLGNSLVPANVDHGVIDEVHWLADVEAFAWTRELARHEQIFAGNSSGSAYAVARWIAEQSDAGTIVAIFPDRGDRYVGTIYNAAYRLRHGVDSSGLPPEPTPITPEETATTWSFARLRHAPVALPR